MPFGATPGDYRRIQRRRRRNPPPKSLKPVIVANKRPRKKTRTRNVLSNPKAAHRKLLALSLGPGSPNPALRKQQRVLFKKITDTYGDGDPLKAYRVLSKKAGNRTERKADSFAEDLLGGGLVGLIDSQVSADARKAVWGSKNPSAAQVGLAALPIGKGAQLVKRGIQAATRGKTAEQVVRATAERTATRHAAAKATGKTGGKAPGRTPGKIRGRVPHPYRATGRGLGKMARAGGARVAGSTAGRRVASSKAGRAVSKAAESKTAAVAGQGVRIASAPARLAVRRPFTTPVLAQAPIAVATGDPEELTKAFEGEGVFARGAASLGDTVSKIAPGEVAGNVVKDAFNLPATVLPSVYLPVAGAVEAAKGDSSRLEKLWKDYKAVGLFPAIASGDLDKALSAIKAHPLFTGLEASGGYALAGRGAGAVLRHSPSPGARKAGGTAREPLTVYGKGEGRVTVPRSYSKNVLTKGAQVAREGSQRRRGKDPDRVSAKKAEIILTGQRSEIPVLEGHRAIPINLVHRFVDMRERVRRTNRDEMTSEFRKREPEKHSAVVSELVQGSVRSPATWKQDLTSRLAELQAAEKAGQLTSSEVKLSRGLQSALKTALKETDPDTIIGLFAVAEEFKAAHAPLMKDLVERGILESGQAAQAALYPFGIRHMGGRYAVPKEGGRARLVDPKGKPLTTQRITAEMRRQGVEEPGFLTHRAGVTGGGSFYRKSVRRPAAFTKRRTGESFKRGAYEAGFDALTAQLAQSRSVHDAAKTLDEFAKSYGVGAGGKRGAFFKDWNDGEQFAAELLENPQFARAAGIPEGLAMVPMRLDRPGARKSELEGIERHATPEGPGILDPLAREEGIAPQRVVDLATDSFKPGPGKVVLVPKVAKDEYLAHNDSMSAAGRGVQALTQGFKSTVLPTSTKWVLGNTFELQMRQLANGIAPFPLTLLDPRYHVGRKTTKEAKRLDPEGGSALEAQTVGTAFTGEQMSRVHRDSDAVSKAFEVVKATPILGHLTRAYTAYARWMFNMNAHLERVGTTAGLGKLELDGLREQNRSQAHAMFLQKDALRDLARGALKTENQIRFAHGLEDMFGRWKANRPGVRKTLLNLAPFWMWTRSATRFVALTLPVKHPIKTGLLAIGAEMSEAERQRLGLDVLADKPLPARLRGAVPTKGGGIIPTEYFTSFGVWADYPENLASTVLPQVQGGLRAMAGYDWKGDQLTNEKGEALDENQRIGVALYVQLESFLPGLAHARRVGEQGGTSVSTSTAWSPRISDASRKRQGGASEGLKRVFLPQEYDPGLVRYLRTLADSRQITIPTTASSSSSSSGGWGGGGW